MNKTIKCLLLKNSYWIISQIEEIEVDYELNAPNCKLVKPHQIDLVYDYKSEEKIEWKDRDQVTVGSTHASYKYEIYPWKEYTNDDEILIFSDFIVTIVEPKPELLEAYLKSVE